VSDRIVYKVVSKGGGVDGMDFSDKGGHTKYASFDRSDAEKHVDGWSELRVEVIEHYEKRSERLLKDLDPVDRLILEDHFS